MNHRFSAFPALLLVVAACTTPASEGGLGPAPVVTNIQISPDSATLQRGDSIVLNVSAHLSDGSNSSIPVGWVATGGTFSAGAVYHAGTTPGRYLIIASTAQLLHADTAVVVIQ
jgi:hypothetical protein